MTGKAKKALVTGGTGFVGANLVRRLLKDGHEVHLLVRPGFSDWRIIDIKPQLHMHQVSLQDEEALSQVVAKIKPDWVFHLAVHGAYSSQINPQTMIGTNILGTVNLLSACLKTGFESFVNTGSSSEYGYKDHPPHEQEWLDPNSYYAITKSTATHFCRYAAVRENMHIPTLRLYSVYGYFEEPSRLIPSLITHGLQGALPPLVHPGIARDYVFIEDVVQAFILAAFDRTSEPGAVYNVGTGMQITLREVVQIVIDIMNIEGKPQWGTMDSRIWDTDIWVANNNKIKEALAWRPAFSLKDGIGLTADWLSRNQKIKDYYNYTLQQGKKPD